MIGKVSGLFFGKQQICPISVWIGLRAFDTTAKRSDSVKALFFCNY